MANNPITNSKQISLVIANMIKEIELTYNLSNGLTATQVNQIKTQFTNIFDTE